VSNIGQHVVAATGVTGSSASRLPTVDIIVSTYNEGRHIDKCLEYVLGQDYPAELVTVWVVDGGSTDNTVAIAQSWANRDQRLRIVATGQRLNLPESLNLGLERSSAAVVAKIDAHGYPEKDYIRRAVDILTENEDVACVGGRPVQEGETSFGRAVARARGSRVGVGGSEYGGCTERQYVQTVQCGVYRRTTLTKIGCFDPAMNFGEDDELNWRLIESGYRILLDTRIRFHYVTRPTWHAAYRQYRNYGRARVMVVRKHVRYLRPYHLVPAVFVAALFGLAMSAIFLPRAAYVLAAGGALYLGVLALESVRLSRRQLTLAPLIATAFIALHFGYGVGMIVGVVGVSLDGLTRRLRPRVIEITPQ